MKKVLSFIILMVCAVTGAWADTSVNLSDGTLTITTTEAGTLSSYSFTADHKAATSVVLVGKFNASDLQAIQTNGNDFKFTSVDMSQAFLVDTRDPNNTSRPEGAVSGYEWFSEVPTGVQNTDKIFVGGDLYKATTETTKQWEEDAEKWNASVVYANNEARDAAIATTPVGTRALVPKDGTEPYTYYQKVDQWNWGNQSNSVPTVDGNEVDYVIGNFFEGNKHNYLNSYDIGQWVRMYVNNNNYADYNCYKLVETVSSLTWGDPLTGKTHETLSYVYPTPEALQANTAATNGQYAVVGGEEYLYDGSTWVKASEATSTVNWKAIKFKYWKETITTAILPPNVVASDLDNPWEELSNQRKLVKVQSGETYADITWGSPNAKIIGKSEEECTRLKEILKLNFIDQNNIQEEINDGGYIRWNSTTGVYDVHVTSAGSLKRHFQALLSSEGANNLNGKVFHFDNECTGFTAEDLQALAPQNGPYVYVDLYDVPATAAVETAIEDAITGISQKGSGYQYKGLLLPKNPDRIGTALILNSGHSPVSDFIAYNTGSTTTAHIYDTSASDESKYEPKVTTLKGIMDVHTAIGSNTSVYLVSTNCKTPIANVESIKGTSTTASIVHTYNNEMVSGTATEPSIEVIPSKAGDYATLNEATNMRNTPNTDVLKFKGAINTADILAVNSFTQVTWSDAANGGNGGYVEAVWSNDANEGNGGWIPAGENDPRTYNGPRVLDLSEVPAATITQDLLNNLENPKIQYVILPAGLDAPVVGNYTKLANLKCVISSDNSSKEGDKVLNAYVREAGSLAEARCLATGNDDGGSSSFKPTAQSLTKVKLSGNLNQNDISTKGDTSGLKGEYTTITSLDLSDAYFANVGDMRLGNEGDGLPGAGFNQSSVLTEVKLPTTMTEIPSYCLYGMKSLHNLHIPYNYTKIGWAAFWESGIDHITAEDALNGALVDNGPKTYTLSAAITELGAPNQQESIAVFPQSVGVTDVYCLGTTAPVCYAHTFHADITYGQGGMSDGVYCREKYQKDSKIIALLHFPSLESYKDATGSENGYANMVSLYTDPTREYSKKDQTGAVDANGNPLTWPDQGELLGSRTMALAGYIWEDYPNLSYQAGGDAHLISLGEPSGEKESFYPNYVGWHEFVLSMATYVEQNNTEGNCYYEDAGMFTFCIPFDMTYSQVVRMMGVPASTDKIKNYLGPTKVIGENNTVTYEGGEKQDADVMPEIRQLASVLRTKGTNGASNTVNFRLTRNLVNGKTAGYLEFSEDGSKETKSAGNLTGSKPDDPICLVGGRPYIIKAYLRAGEKDKLIARNLGKFIMTRYASEFGLSASCVNSEEYSEQLETFTGEANAATVKLKNNEPEKLVTMKFAKPYENHKVLAVDGAENGGALNYVKDDETETGYYYTFVGQFWEQDLPLYCVYLGQNGSWYRYSKENANYKWNAYKCVIMATPEVTATSDIKEENAIETAMGIKPDVTANPQPYTALATGYNFNHFGGGFRNISHCYFPMNYVGTTDLIPAPMSLWFIGRDDYTFKNQTAASSATSRYIFSIDDDEEIVDLGENVTEVKAIDMLDGVPQIYGDMKVYNLSGQYVGNSTEGLSKGIYIVGGRKVVVE